MPHETDTLISPDDFKNNYRKKMIGIKLTEKEHAKVKSYCKRKNITISRYFRQLVRDDIALNGTPVGGKE